MLDGPREVKREFSTRRLEATVAGGKSLIYRSTVSLFYRSSNLISSLENPFTAAEAAAPFRSECPEKPWVDMLALRRYSWILSIKYCFEKGPIVRLNVSERGVAGYWV